MVVDIYFKNTGDKQNNYIKLNELIGTISSKYFDFDLIKLISDTKLKDSEISPRVKLFAYKIDTIIKSKDIFWIFFFLIYSAHFVKNEDRNYTYIVRSMSEDFLKMICVFEDELERVEDDCDLIYDAYLEAIYEGIAQAFEKYNKLSFFIYKINLNIINDITVNMVKSFQHKITPETQEIIQRNLNVITLLTKCKIVVTCKDIINIEEVVALKDLLLQEDCFDIDFNFSYFDEKLKQLEVINQDHFRNLFVKEGK